MNIRKRTGEVVPFQEEKILNAMKKAFSGQAQELDDRMLDEMLSVVLKRLPGKPGGLTVERVQDEVERVLMECGHYEVAKAYILYREKRAALRRVRADLAREVGMMPLRTSCSRSRRISRKRFTPSAPCS